MSDATSAAAEAALAAYFQRALALHRQGQLPQAEMLYRVVLQKLPGHAEAMHMLGVIAGQNQRWLEAVDWLERAVALNAGQAALHNNLGNAQHALGRFDAALASYERAVAVQPGHATALKGRGDCLRALARAEDAVRAYREAAAAGADREQIDYLLAALGAQPLPPASPAAYVTELFDKAAARFDAQLVGTLHYRTPELLLAAIQAAGDAQQGGGQVLDLGCGTGLCGPLLRPLARHLCGVDLSPGMLEQARAKGVYDALACADLTAFLQAPEQVPAGSIDLAVAADVLVYIGELRPVFAAVHAALRPGGLFAFSTEAAEAGAAIADGPDIHLGPALRYAHSERYLRALAAATGFELASLAHAVLRHEAAAPVRGHLAVLRRPRST